MALLLLIFFLIRELTPYSYGTLVELDHHYSVSPTLYTVENIRRNISKLKTLLLLVSQLAASSHLL